MRDAAVATGAWRGKGVDGDGTKIDRGERWTDTWVKTSKANGNKWPASRLRPNRVGSGVSLLESEPDDFCGVLGQSQFAGFFRGEPANFVGVIGRSGVSPYPAA
jgi:hypothetical protein